MLYRFWVWLNSSGAWWFLFLLFLKACALLFGVCPGRAWLEWGWVQIWEHLYIAFRGLGCPPHCLAHKSFFSKSHVQEDGALTVQAVCATSAAAQLGDCKRKGYETLTPMQVTSPSFESAPYSTSFCLLCITVVWYYAVLDLVFCCIQWLTETIMVFLCLGQPQKS